MLHGQIRVAIQQRGPLLLSRVCMHLQPAVQQKALDGDAVTNLLLRSASASDPNIAAFCGGLRVTCCTGTPVYDLQALAAAERQVPLLPFSEQWKLPQPVSAQQS